MENTLENKAKFFAVFWGQKVHRSLGYLEIEKVDRITLYSIENKDFLELTPLSSISDKHAIDLAKILCSKLTGSEAEARVAKKEEKGANRTDKIVYIGENYIITVEELKVLGNYNGWVNVQDYNNLSNAIDFLRSKGYALPWMGLSIEKQVEYGWVKLIN